MVRGMSPPPEVVARIGEVVLWIPADLCSGSSQKYRGTDPPGGMESDFRPFTFAYEVYLHCVGRWMRGVAVIVECAGEDLPWPECICMVRVELVLGSSPLTESWGGTGPFSRREPQVATPPCNALRGSDGVA